MKFLIVTAILATPFLADARMVDYQTSCSHGEYGATDSLSLGFPVMDWDQGVTDATSIAYARNGSYFDYEIVEIKKLSEPKNWESESSCEDHGAHVSRVTWNQVIWVHAKSFTGEKRYFQEEFKCEQSTVIDPRISDCPQGN